MQSQTDNPIQDCLHHEAKLEVAVVATPIRRLFQAAEQAMIAADIPVNAMTALPFMFKEF